MIEERGQYWNKKRPVPCNVKVSINSCEQANINQYEKTNKTGDRFIVSYNISID